MSPLEQSQIRTRMFARVLGPFFATVPTTVAIRGSYMQTLFTEFKANPMWPWLFGAILLMFGLVIIQAPHHTVATQPASPPCRSGRDRATKVLMTNS